MCTTICVLSKNKKNIKNFQLQIFKLKNLCLLHGQVFEMIRSQYCKVRNFRVSFISQNFLFPNYERVLEFGSVCPCIL